MEHLKYPIGKYQRPDILSEDILKNYIDEIASLPEELEKAIQGLSEKDLETLYRPGGWTIRQVVHHLADSHINSYTRFKLALTEDTPSIKPYQEDKWAELEDGKKAPLHLSVQLLKALHERWVVLLKALKPEDLNKRFYHPEQKKEIALKENIGIYAWHGKHHLAHIEQAKRIIIR